MQRLSSFAANIGPSHIAQRTGQEALSPIAKLAKLPRGSNRLPIGARRFAHFAPADVPAVHDCRNPIDNC